MPTRAKALVQRVAGSMLFAVFGFYFFLYGYCDAYRPSEPLPSMGFDHPVNFKGRLLYIDSFESFFLNGYFFWFATLAIILVLCRSAGRVLQYDVRRGKVTWVQPDERVDWPPFAMLIVFWLALLVAAWRVSL